MIRPGTDLFSTSFQSSNSLLNRTHRFWASLVILIPLVLIILGLSGYYYTVLQLSAKLRLSLGLAVILAITNALLLRWLFINRRKLAIEQAKQRAKAKIDALESKNEAGEPTTGLDTSDRGGPRRYPGLRYANPTDFSQCHYIDRGSWTLLYLVGCSASSPGGSIVCNSGRNSPSWIRTTHLQHRK